MAPTNGNGCKTILVVDDDSSVVQLVCEILASQNYEVLRAETVELAIAAVRSHPVDLLLIDAVMPKVSGPELADVLLFLRSDMKVLFVTGLDTLAIKLAFDRPCECLQKPFTPRQLVAKVGEALASPAAVADQAHADETQRNVATR